ncbi:MAG TPA: glycerate kinase [Xanthobacteraceae bacterium]|nr:glycerate kinase [Xanthobacteraceae bacterium]
MPVVRTFLRQLFDTAVAAAHPNSCLATQLPPPPHNGRLIVLAAGKAAGSMTVAAERHYLDTCRIEPGRMMGHAVSRHGYGRATRVVTMAEAGHPIPDAAGIAAAERALALAGQAGRDDLVLVLLSGGASANWIAPAPGVSLQDKQAVTHALLLSGATISEINVVRKHLSRIKGGRLAVKAQPARVVTLAISDVPGDSPTVIGSGPTVGDPSTLEEARAIAEKYRLELPQPVARALFDPGNETPKPHDPAFTNTEFHLVARPRDAFQAAENVVRAAGLECVRLGEHLEGEAEVLAVEHARLARELQAQGRRAVILSGGELTVTVRGRGRGGPNQHYALALALALDGTPGIAALAADTDGTDGGAGSPHDPAGAFVDETTLARARALGLDPAAFLNDSDSTAFFAQLDDLLMTGPTYTNVNDFRAILVDRPQPLREMRN